MPRVRSSLAHRMNGGASKKNWVTNVVSSPSCSANAAFSRSGLVHLLSISGFHVGVVFGWAMLLLRALRGSRESAAAVSAALVLLYVSFLGWPAPAARAALLCALVSWSLARQRNPGAGSLLAVTCLGSTLLDPWAIFDLGGWLSASALLGAMTFSRWSDRSLAPRAGWRMFFASVGAARAWQACDHCMIAGHPRYPREGRLFA